MGGLMHENCPMAKEQAMTRVYRDGKVVAEHFPVEQVSEHLKTKECVIWVDLCDPDKGELDQLAHELGLHELAVEDALDQHQRPKLDRYQSHLFLSVNAVRGRFDAGVLDETEIDAFISTRWLITVRKNDAFDMAAVLQRWDRSPDLARFGVSFLLYGLLDVVVDGYFETVQAFDEYYEDVSDDIFADRPIDPSQQRHWFDMRKAMVRFHRLAVPMREAVSSLMRREHTIVQEELYPYYQDVYDHILRVSESTDFLRDLVSTIVETNLSLRDFRQNQVVKKVSSWAAIIAVPALITGYFGMNVPFPGYGQDAGAIASVLLLVGACVGLYFLFRRVDWL
jgi:magnesium transporter